jgi:hypothetical protein
LIAISHAEAALTLTVLSGSSSNCRASCESLGASATAQSATCVSSSSLRLLDAEQGRDFPVQLF